MAKWISAKKKLPEEGSCVLAFIPWVLCGECEVMRYKDGVFESCSENRGGFYPPEEIKWWMPLPKFPKPWVSERPWRRNTRIKSLLKKAWQKILRQG